MSRHNHEWPEDATALLKRSWNEGYSASQISVQLRGCGHQYSRNAVIGKVHRLRLLSRGTRPTKAQLYGNAASLRRDRPLRRITKKNAGEYYARKPSPELKLAQDLAEIRALAPIDPTLGVLGLNQFTCRYPIGDPDDPAFAFCGRPSDPDRAFCADHHRLCYQPAKPKERRHEARVRPSWREGWEVAA